VVSAEKVYEDGDNEVLGRSDAFMVDHGTKVHLFLEKTSFGLCSEDSIDKIVVDSPRLGGLSKEYSVLRDIIISSSVKNTLSSKKIS
ncbi:hypothetical protein Tco_0055890, partial [Tanacetum coccineum]